MKHKPIKFGLQITILLFFISFGLCILAAFLAKALNLKLFLFLFMANLISTFLFITILGGLFTSLTSSISHLRRLLRLDNLSHPLLLRLSSEAPGTFHHSKAVADLAGRAAKAIGADSLLVRVSGYFHDIGKLKNPLNFAENQTIKNEFPNKDEKFSENAEKIIDHVKEGIELLKEYHLPNEIINLIPQHHGTTLVSSYYEKAKKEFPSKIKRASFRYKGPRPQTKEAAILMLADSTEAKIRQEKELTKDIIEEIVDETILEKERERQLAESPLSLFEISQIKKSFIHTLEGMFHKRILH